MNYQTGIIWKRSEKERLHIVSWVCNTLVKVYGTPRLGNPFDPIDDLIFIIISNKTSPAVACKTFNALKDEFSDWNEILESHYTKLRSILKQAGLSSVKSKQIRAILKKIIIDYNTLDLKYLRENDSDIVEQYLISLPGVSEKVAKCVMLYTLDIEVLPVDSHVHRISRRLGWTDRRRADQCHKELEKLVLPKLRYGYHVNCILHGRKICRPNNPICEKCIISKVCIYCKVNK